MEVIAGLTIFLALFAIDNKEFLNTKNEQVSQGYEWVQIKCRKPNKELPHIKTTTPIGNEYVCWKLVKE